MPRRSRSAWADLVWDNPLLWREIGSSRRSRWLWTRLHIPVGLAIACLVLLLMEVKHLQVFYPSLRYLPALIFFAFWSLPIWCCARSWVRESVEEWREELRLTSLSPRHFIVAKSCLWFVPVFTLATGWMLFPILELVAVGLIGPWENLFPLLWRGVVDSSSLLLLGNLILCAALAIGATSLITIAFRRPWLSTVLVVPASWITLLWPKFIDIAEQLWGFRSPLPNAVFAQLIPFGLTVALWWWLPRRVAWRLDPKR